VWFTLEDVLKIGEKLPELMSHHRLASEAPAADGQVKQSTSSAAARESEGVAGPMPAHATPPVVDIAAWAQLKAHRPRSRGR
jgi:hypothetical protein